MSTNIGSLGYKTSTAEAYSPSPRVSSYGVGNLSVVGIAKFALACIALSSRSLADAKPNALSSLEVTPDLIPASEVSIVHCLKVKNRPDPSSNLTIQRFLGGQKVEPSSKEPIYEFPIDTCNKATQLGVYVLDGGRSGCNIGSYGNNSGIWDVYPEPKKCKKRIQDVKHAIESLMLRPMRHSCDHLTRYHIQDDHPITDVSLDMSPARMVACRSTYDYVQKEFLGNIDSSKRGFSSAQIIDLLKEIHFRATHGDSEGGKFRETITHIDFGPFVQQLRRAGASEEDYTTLQSIFDAIDRSNLSIDEMMRMGNFSEEQLDVLSRVAIIPPNPTQLKGELRVFARKLSERLGDVLERRRDAISVAAWAHQQILRMHPFMDGNARVARVVLNTILQIGGYEAVGFPSEEAFYESMKDPESFWKHLAKVVKWNQSQRALKA